jgi:hypothetical protein
MAQRRGYLSRENSRTHQLTLCHSVMERKLKTSETRPLPGIETTPRLPALAPSSFTPDEVHLKCGSAVIESH